MSELDGFQYLWDGSDPGWKLMRVDRVVWRVGFEFKSTGPSEHEVTVLRQLLAEFRDLPASQVWNRLRGARKYQVQAEFDDAQACELGECATKLGVCATLLPVNQGGYVPVSPDGSAMAIEDDALAKEIVAKMLQVGVPVEDLNTD